MAEPICVKLCGIVGDNSENVFVQKKIFVNVDDSSETCMLLRRRPRPPPPVKNKTRTRWINLQREGEEEEMREDCTSKWKLNVAPPKSGWRDRERERDRKYGYDGEVGIEFLCTHLCIKKNIS